MLLIQGGDLGHQPADLRLGDTDEVNEDRERGEPAGETEERDHRGGQMSQWMPPGAAGIVRWRLACAR